jgi:hypothetical protein
MNHPDDCFTGSKHDLRISIFSAPAQVPNSFSENQQSAIGINPVSQQPHSRRRMRTGLDLA